MTVRTTEQTNERTNNDDDDDDGDDDDEEEEEEEEEVSPPPAGAHLRLQPMLRASAPFLTTFTFAFISFYLLSGERPATCNLQPATCNLQLVASNQ